MLGMLVLLKLMFKLAPTGIVNYTGMELVFERLGRKWPGLNGTSKSLNTWAGAMSQSLRIAMAHVRKLAQQPKRFDQRTKGLTPKEKEALKEILVLYIVTVFQSLKNTIQIFLLQKTLAVSEVQTKVKRC